MAVVIIPARYGSSRLPGKVLSDIYGKPMIVRVVEQCKKSRAEKVIVVTDDERVKVALANEGVTVVMSAPDIATGTDRIAFVAKNLTDEIVINVQGDEPFIPPQLIDSLIDNLEKNISINMNTAAVPFESVEEALNPSHVKVVFDKRGYALYFSRSVIPYLRESGEITTKYRHIGIYGFRREFLMQFAIMEKTALESSEMLEQLRALENGEKICVLKTTYTPISVDTKEDLDKAVAVYKKLNNII